MTSSGNGEDMEGVILELLRQSDRELTADELKQKLTEHYQHDIDPWDVREAIWRLIADKQAVLTSQRAVKVR